MTILSSRMATFSFLTMSAGRRWAFWSYSTATHWPCGLAGFSSSAIAPSPAAPAHDASRAAIIHLLIADRRFLVGTSGILSFRLPSLVLLPPFRCLLLLAQSVARHR